ncbi:hypothetical protein ACLOJK_001385 [Asimina triloba]
MVARKDVRSRESRPYLHTRHSRDYFWNCEIISGFLRNFNQNQVPFAWRKRAPRIQRLLRSSPPPFSAFLLALFSFPYAHDCETVLLFSILLLKPRQPPREKSEIQTLELHIPLLSEILTWDSAIFSGFFCSEVCSFSAGAADEASSLLSSFRKLFLSSFLLSLRHRTRFITRRFRVDSAADNLAPWATGLLQFAPMPAFAPDAKFPLILAAERTNRPDILRGFKHYHGGWDITNRHYWASVGYTGAAGFILAFLWFLSFGIVFVVHRCCRRGLCIKNNYYYLQQICLALLLVFTCTAAVGCILLTIGQDEFHGEMMDTMHFVVNQSDFTVQILRNVTGYLSLAKAINVEQVFVPSDVKDEIDRRSALIVIAAVMLALAILGLGVVRICRNMTVNKDIYLQWVATCGCDLHALWSFPDPEQSQLTKQLLVQ